MDPLVTPAYLARMLDAGLAARHAGAPRSGTALESALGAISGVLTAVGGAPHSGVRAVRARGRALDTRRLEGVVVGRVGALLAILGEALPAAAAAASSLSPLCASPSFDAELVGASAGAGGGAPTRSCSSAPRAWRLLTASRRSLTGGTVVDGGGAGGGRRRPLPSSASPTRTPATPCGPAGAGC
eukprot:TRINITY_DN10637_c0_g1_i1.p2 TRINITY_DN10637_c0_g1~~TRINITY_DN10637_c0_g1_i1.p2  ORF type:complete len:185 (-),score=49.40 TRINITY_DN10637_c0_g1_i1:242-796(-)